jgi:hypothetical protein
MWITVLLRDTPQSLRLLYRSKVRSRTWSSRALLALVAWLADGCVFINYDEGSHKLVGDGGGVVPDDGGAEVDANLVPEAGLDARTSDAATHDASARDAAADAAYVDAEGGSHGDDAGGDAAADAGADADASADASVCTPNACGGCSALSDTLDAACGSCGAGVWMCDGSEALACSNDGPGKAPGNPVLIDDFEDGDALIIGSYGMSGSWYTVSDGTTGTISPAVGSTPVPANVGALSSARSMHFTGSGFSSWGAGLAVSLNASRCSYDTSLETGVEFYIKGTGSVNVEVATRQTVKQVEGGTCIGKCNDFYHLTVPLSGTWTQKKVAYSTLAQYGWGVAAAFDPTQVMYIQFTLSPGSSVDFYVDNLSFY